MADTPDEGRDVSQNQPSPPPPPGPPQEGAQPPPPAPGDPAAAKAQAKADKAYAKSMRPWYKKKRFIIPLALVLIIVIVAVAGSGDDDDDAEPVAGGDDAPAAEESESDPSDTRNLSLYPDRPDRQDEDHEAEVGDSVRLAGYTATVTDAEFVSDEIMGEQVIVFVTIENRDDSAQSYNMFDWRIQTEGGQVLDPTVTLRDDDLGSGDLVSGGRVEGTVGFDVGAGTYFVIYKPDQFNSARGIWRIEV